MVKTSKPAIVTSATVGKIASIFGYIIAGFMLIVILAVFIPYGVDSADLTIGSIFLGISAALIIKGIQIKQRIRRFRNYVSLISNNNMTSLDSIATATNQPVGFVRNDLQRMINKRFFMNTTIDFARNEIVVGRFGAAGASPVPPQAQNASQSVEMESFTCPGCGASGGKQKGSTVNCEYCGSFVK